MSEKVFWENSNAKINLFLEVLYSRRDGYHQIKTILNEIDLHDEISFSKSKRIEVKLFISETMNSSVFPQIDMKDNITYKAAQLMQRKYSVSDGVNISIKKNIPVGAGLGGGSSNAALTIKTLSSLWNLSLTPNQMKEIASEIGSDVPFFLEGKTALGEGRGEKIIPLESIIFDRILLVKPDFGISTSTAYNLIDNYGDNKNWQKILTATSNINISTTSSTNAKGKQSDELLKLFFNRFEKPIRTKFTQIDQIIHYLSVNGAIKTMLSGSGSTVFAIYDNEDIREQHYNYFRNLGLWTIKTKSVS